jgi:multiple sugar transport system permease protein
MSIRTEPLSALVSPQRRALTLAGWLDREAVFSWLMMALPLLFLAAFVGYPLVYGVLLSLQDRQVAKPGVFVGLKNFIADFHDPIFWRVAINTFIYTIAATLLKMVGGGGRGRALNQQFRIKKLDGTLIENS